MSNPASISVIIPVFNGEAYLAETIESVLAQTRQPAEIIVVDDGSTDGTAAIADTFGGIVRTIRQPNRGAAAARNRGVELSDGQFLTFLDADDLWTEDKLEIQLRALEANPDLEAVYCHVRQFRSPELAPEVKQRIKIPVEVMPGRSAITMLIKRESFERIGMFNESLSIGESIDWHARADEQGLRVTLLPQALVMRRLHQSSQGTIKRDQRIVYTQVIKAALDRRRKIKKVKKS